MAAEVQMLHLPYFLSHTIGDPQIFFCVILIFTTALPPGLLGRAQLPGVHELGPMRATDCR